MAGRGVVYFQELALEVPKKIIKHEIFMEGKKRNALTE